LRYSLSIIGDENVAFKLRLTGRQARDMRPVFNDVADYLMDITGKQFDSQGRRGGGAWARLTPKWAAYKARHGYDPRILHMRGPLRRSVTVRQAKGQILRITPQTMTFGTSIDYAGVHQHGFETRQRYMPARPFLRVLPGDQRKINQMLTDHLMRPWRGGVRRG
jgi:phage virion morphogenesis protein